MKNKNKIKNFVHNCGNITSKIVSKRHGIVMDGMEKSLVSWIGDQHQKDIPLSISIIQAKALSLLDAWKTRLYYMRSIMYQAIRATDREDGPTLKDFWKNYNIWNAVNNIGDAWAEISESTMKGSWKQLCPQMMNDIINSDETPEAITIEIVNLMNDLNLDVNNEDVNEMIDSHSESLTNEYLIEQQEYENRKNNKDEEEEGVKIIKTLTIKNMNEAFMHLDKFFNIMEECDPDGERISKVRRAIYDHTACYRSLYEEKKKNSGIQLTLDKFLKP